MQRYDVIVVGAGISGASLAFRCAKKGQRTLLIERDDSAGGCLRSHRTDTGYWFELGAHTCYNSYGQLLALIDETLGEAAIVRREKQPFRLLVDGRVCAIGRELSVPRLLMAPLLLPFASKTGKTVRAYYGGLVGQRNYEHVFSALFAAVPSQRADDFPADMLFKRRDRRKDRPRSFTLASGLQSIVDALVATEGVHLRTGVEATRVRRKGGSFEVELSQGEAVVASRLALAVPPPVGAALVGDAAPELEAALGKVGAVSIRTLAVAVRAESVRLEPMAGLIPLDRSFFSAVTRDTVPDVERRAFAFHFAGATAFETAETIVAEVLGVEDSKIEVRVRRKVTLPSPVVGHAATVAEIEAASASSGIEVTGNFFGGLAIEDCVTRSREIAERLTG